MLEEETGLAEETARAMRELARTVTDAPPLRLAPRPGVRAGRQAGYRWRLWAVPLTAAAAVIALAVSLVTIRDIPNGRVVPPPGPVSPPIAGVPEYYAMPEHVCNTCQSTRLVVGETFTGAKVATFSPPRGTTFQAVSAAEDDRTFVADTVEFPYASLQHVRWYLLKITPGASSPARLTRLPIPATPPAARVGTIALSPSGRELAVTYQLSSAQTATTVLRIYSVATGNLLHSWSTDQNVVLGPFDYAPYVQSNNQLSWVDGDRAIAFATGTLIRGRNPFQDNRYMAMRILDVARGGDLIRDSRVVWSIQTPVTEQACDGSLSGPSLTASGKTIVCSDVSGGPGPGGGSATRRYRWQLAWLAYETSAQKVARTLYSFTAYSTGHTGWDSAGSVQWSDASGATVIIAWSIAAPSPHFGVVSHGRFTPLPSPPGITLGTPPDIAW